MSDTQDPYSEVCLQVHSMQAAFRRRGSQLFGRDCAVLSAIAISIPLERQPIARVNRRAESKTKVMHKSVLQEILASAGRIDLSASRRFVLEWLLALGGQLQIVLRRA